MQVAARRGVRPIHDPTRKPTTPRVAASPRCETGGEAFGAANEFARRGVRAAFREVRCQEE